LEDFLIRIDIVVVIGCFLEIGEASRNQEKDEWVVSCPFHTERSPSFRITGQKQFYHCHGCGAHGNAVKFVRDHCGLSTVQAMIWISKEFQVPIRWSVQKLRDEKRRCKKKFSQKR
jgi:DNA primase